jgi:predicted outer membrane repeat protein
MNSYPNSSRKARHLPVLFLHVALLLSVIAARAAGIYYVKPGGSGTGTGSWANAMGATQLQAAINAASAAGGGQVWVAAGTYLPGAYPAGATSTLSNRDYAFTLANGVAVYGGFAGTETLLSQRNYSTNVTILSGDINTAGTYTDDCYHILVSTGNNNTAILDGFTIEFGYANGGTSTITYSGVQMDRNHGGAIFLQSSQPQLSNCQFVNNKASSGGAIYNNNTASPPLFSNCGFSSNAALTTTATDGGGAIYNANNTFVSLASCTFLSNVSASDGGGIFSNNSCNMTLTGCSFTSNTAAGNGGGFVNEASSLATLSNCTFTSNQANSASAGGGAICNNSTNGFSATNCVFSNNSAALYGGGIYFMSGSSQSTMSGCSFASNTAVYGGGLSAGSGSNQTITTTTFTSNSATYGGGVYNSSSSYNYSNCTFSSNSASAASGMGGGGECNDVSSNGYMLHCLFLNNVSAGDGAGQYNNSSNSVDSECVFNGNVSHGNGGGMVYNGGNPKAYNCVLSDNTASSYGGGLYNVSANATFENNTVYNNAANSAGGYGDGIYVLSGSPKIYNDIVWSRSNAASVGLVYATGITPKVQYSDIQNAVFPGTGNISTAPTFENSGSYVGLDGIWATADDGLHLADNSAGVSTIPTGNATAYDITMSTRPSPGPQSSMGAYEGQGSFATLAFRLLSLVALSAGDRMVVLSWQAPGVVAGATFRIGRSTDGRTFGSMGNVESSPGMEQYTFRDGNAVAGDNYYRVELDLPGVDTAMSPVVLVNMPYDPGSRLSLRPSVGTQRDRVLFFRAIQSSPAVIRILDAGGHIQWSRNAALLEGDNYLSLDLAPLAAGIYYLSICPLAGSRETLPFSIF